MDGEVPQHDEGKVVQLCNWVIDRAIGGVQIGSVEALASAESLANQYLSDRNLKTDDERINALIQWEVGKNFTTGFVTGLGGVLTLPVAIPGAFGASWVIQSRMSAAIAYIRGYDLSDDRVRTFILMTLVADAIEDILNKTGVQIGQKLAEQLILKIPGQILKQINKQVGFRLLTKAGEKGIINLIKVVPAVGGVVSGTLDAAACLAVANAAKALFPPQVEPGLGRETVLA